MEPLTGTWACVFGFVYVRRSTRERSDKKMNMKLSPTEVRSYSWNRRDHALEA